VSYRKIDSYFKSIERYKVERARRKQIRVLAEQGLTRKQIAERLGLSERTVYRDLKKTEKYYRGKINRSFRKLGEARRRMFKDQAKGMPVHQQLKVLSKLNKAQGKQREKEERKARTLIFIINLDDLADGVPSIMPSSKYGTFNLRKEITIKFLVQKDGKTEELGNYNLH